MAESWATALQQAQDALKKHKVTHDLVASRVKQGLNAKEIRTHFDASRAGSGTWEYSKPLVAYHIRLGWAKLAAELLDMEPAKKHIFPGEDGKPQAISPVFGETERSARLIFLLEQAEKRAKEANNAASGSN